MKNFYIICIVLLSACDSNHPDAIKDRIYLDTVKQGDTTVIRPDIVLPEDQTKVADTVGQKVGPVH